MEGDLADTALFAAPAAELEEGAALTPKFDANGLITAVATDAKTGDVLMVAHMNAQALAKTIATGEAWYFSRSRNALWKKGETSGHTQHVVDMRIDCDQDDGRVLSRRAARHVRGQVAQGQARISRRTRL